MNTPWPEPDDVLPIRVRPQSGDELVRPTVNALGALVEGIGDDNRFLVLERVPYANCVFIQAFRDEDGNYNVEFRDGGREMFASVIDDVADVFWVLVGWALDAPAWRTGVDWGLSYTHPEVEVTPLSEAVANSATRLARRYLVEGYLTFERMAQTISECAEDGKQVTIEQAEQLLEPLWNQRAAEQRTWPEVTDVDRIEATFGSLNGNGITARAHFACCQNCGVAEIGGEAAPGDRGYVFFHFQDTESAVDGRLYLSFGAYTKADEADDEAGAAVGREVVAALTAEGLEWTWDGTGRSRVIVTGLDWKKRLE